MIRALGLIALLAGPAQGQGIVSARFAEPTGAYGHHPMGPSVADHRALALGLADGTERLIRLPADRVFEDNAARLADIDGDGAPEVVVVEADFARGARLSVYGVDGLIAASPYIGRRNRWMAVAAIADLDGDGAVEIAVVDRPHLRKTLVVWRQDGAELRRVAEFAGVTNHHLGEAEILGGLRDCGTGPEVVVARADWSRLVALRLRGGALEGTDLGADATQDDFTRALGCRR